VGFFFMTLSFARRSFDFSLWRMTSPDIERGRNQCYLNEKTIRKWSFASLVFC
jgi:hypothetical protein